MAIVKMKRLRLAAMQQDRDELLALLQRMGCVEIDEPSVEEGQLKRPEGEGLSLAREGRSNAERALEVLKKYAPEKKGMLTPRPELTVEQLLDAEQGTAAAQQAAQLQQMQLLMEYQQQQQQFQAQQDAAKEKRFIKYGSIAAAFLILTYMMKDNK